MHFFISGSVPCYRITACVCDCARPAWHNVYIYIYIYIYTVHTGSESNIATSSTYTLIPRQRLLLGVTRGWSECMGGGDGGGADYCLINNNTL